MGHAVGFQEPRSGFIPLVGLNRDVSFQQGPRLGGDPPPFVILDPHWYKKPIDRSRRDLPEKIVDLRKQIAEVLGVSG